MDKVRSHNDNQLKKFKSTPQGVGWNSLESQIIRFDQSIKVLSGEGKECFSLNDLGCGYGALLRHLLDKGYAIDYKGYDITSEITQNAFQHWAKLSHDQPISFAGIDELRPAQYTIASGLFGMKFDLDNETWLSYVLDVLDQINNNSEKGFAFNMLTKYSDSSSMRDELYYADPCWIFDYCKRNFSRNVALLHDYTLYDFTIIVRKNVNSIQTP